MRSGIVVLLFLFSFVAASEAQSGVASWNLPQPLSDSNTSIRFELDSTWHMVHGATSGITGQASLGNPSDPRTVVVSLSVPVGKFDTDNSSRDKKMRRVMFADKYPLVKFESSGLKNNCTPALVLKNSSCNDIMPGTLSIAGKSRAVELPVSITKEAENAFRVSGHIPIKWAEFGVEDPSIFIARIKPVVTVFFDVQLRPTS